MTRIKIDFRFQDKDETKITSHGRMDIKKALVRVRLNDFSCLSRWSLWQTTGIGYISDNEDQSGKLSSRGVALRTKSRSKINVTAVTCGLVLGYTGCVA